MHNAFRLKPWFTQTALIAICAAALLPFLWMLSTSFKTLEMALKFPPQFVPSPFEPSNYADVFRNPNVHFLLWTRNTVILAALVVFGTTISSALVAYGFAKMKFRGSAVMFAIMLSTMMIPFPVTMVSLFSLFRWLGDHTGMQWLGTYKPLWVPAWFGSAFNIFLLRQFFLTLPNDLSEAARIDGCSDIGIFLRIILPLSTPALTVVALFSFMGVWNDFLGPLVYIQRPQQFTLALGLQNFQTQLGGTPWHQLMAASVMVILPVMILYFLAQRNLHRRHIHHWNERLRSKMTLLQKKIASIFFILPVFGLIARAEVPSQPYVWKNVKVVAGGFVPAIVFSRVEKGLTYCRTDIGGCYRWDDARRKWLPLTDFMDESSYFGGESIAPDPVDADTVYIAGGMYSSEKAAMLRSRDKGKTWDIFPVSFRMGGNEDGRGMGERLAVDPSDNRILYFGSRYEGLWKSEDSAATWHQVVNFPIKGLGNPNQRGERHGGLSFVLFDATGVEKGSPSKTIFVGCADPGDSHLFRSDNSGKTWFAVEGQPSNKMLPAHAELEDGGILYIAYGSGIGPNGVSDGQVWKLDTQTGQWKNISPEKGPNKPAGGYFGLSLDRQHPGTLGVATMNRWGPGDTIWRTVDGGKTWTDIAERSERNVSLSPYLYWGAQKPRLGWWMSAFAIDPFNSDHAAYGTGATIYATDDFSNTSLDRATHWHVWGEGIEETAVIGLISPTDGPHLVSAFGDIGGFAHDDIDVSPAAGMFLNPLFITTVTIDYAGAQPSVIVRGGQPRDGQAPLAYSEDGGHNWTPLSAPAAAAAGRRGETPGVLVSADGRTFVLLSRTLQFTREQGRVWSPVRGLPTGCRPVADRVNGSIFLLL